MTPHVQILALTALLTGATGHGAPAEEELIPPATFREFAEGYTLHFERDGTPFGAESFAPGGHTVWQYRDGNCDQGMWKPYGAQVCFVYADTPKVLCWRMLRDETGILARLLGDGPDAGMELRIIRRDRQPLLCAGPEA